MNPLIGIVTRVEYPGETHKLIVHEDCRKKIVEFGGIPIGICPCSTVDYTITKYVDQPELSDDEKEMIIKQINCCDGILMPGGFKITKFDRFVVEYAIENDIPLLGICLGMQVMANYKKELWNEKNDSFIEHKVEGLAHYVTLDKESILYSIVGKDKLMVNSRHSFHVLPNDCFEISSVSDDNYIESIEMRNKKFVVGVQWHPETLDDESSKKIFEKFIKTCL